MRRRVRQFSGKVLGRLLRLPAECTGYTVHQVKIPMRDGAQLAADHYAPNSGPVGTVLVRGPYGRGFPLSLIFAMLYAARGYHVVLQSVRGTFGSTGVFEPMVHEAADGADTVAWLREQPWFTGRFATVGVSYLGFTQWALLSDPPPELAAAVITSGPHDFGESSWGTGSFTINDFLGWSDIMAHQEDPGRLRSGIRQLRARRKVADAARQVPLGAAGRALLGDGAPWFESWLEHSDPDDPFWQPMRCNAALERVQVPVLLVGGWQDLFLQQTLEQYRRLRDRGVDVALTIGPWTHTRLLSAGLAVITRESLQWLETHLGDARMQPRRDPVRVFVTGEGWRSQSDWPPPTSARALYLQPDSGLADTPTQHPQSVTFRYDPADPTPTIGGRLLSPDAGRRDDSRLARRNDVLSFTGEALAEEIYVHGNPVVELRHAADIPHVDLFVRVSEVDTRGRSRNVSDGYQRMTDARPDGNTVTVELDPIAHRFSAGSRIRVLIAGGSHPRYARNLGAGEPVATGRQVRSAVHTVHLGPSRLLLPVPEDSAEADPAGRPPADA